MAITLRTTPGYTWPLMPDAELSQAWVAYQELQRTQWLTPEEIQRRQLQQIRTVLAYAVAETAYYRRLLAEAGVTPGAIQSMEDFRRLPLLSRETCQEQQAALTAQRLPPGTVATGTVSTSGSSGIPLGVPQTNIVNLWWCALFLRDLDWCGIDPTGTLASIRSHGQTGADLQPWLEGTTSLCWLPLIETLIESGPAFGMDIQQDPRRQWQWLRQIAPDYLLSYTTNLEVLASIALEECQGLPGLRLIHAIAEPLSEMGKQKIEKAFGVPVKSTYSCAEAGYLASPCPASAGWHVHSENVILEVLDGAGRPCGPGQTGRAVLTTLHNFRAPFIRYELGDALTLGSGPCPCGRGLPLLACIDGKNRPMFRLAGGRLKCSSGVADLLEHLGGHRQHQVIQITLDHVVVRLATDLTWSDGHADRLRRQLQDFFEAPIQVDLVLLDRLELSSSGKLRSMVCELE